MTISWATKDPNEVRSYSYSWLGRLNGAEIASATLTVAAGTVTLSNVANTLSGISATIMGGNDCEDAQITSTIVTSAGETLEETFTLSIRSSAYSSMGPSTSTKRQLIEMAYEECSLSGYEFNVTPEELFTGLRRLDSLMAQWRVESLDLNYNAPATFGGGDLDDYSGIPDAAITAASISLAKAISPTFAKSMSPESTSRLTQGMAAIRVMCAVIPRVGYNYGTPKGAGNRNQLWGSPFLRRGRCR